MRALYYLAGAVLAASAFAAPASDLADVSLHDRRDGRELPVYWHEGRRYVVGEPGREYEIRVRNHSGERVLAVTSVDGVNVLSGQTAAPDQGGYVIDAQGQTRIEGWRKSLSEVATFTFTRLPDSYAARTGRPKEVGVVGVALFTEKTLGCRHWRVDEDRGGRFDAPAAAPQSERPSTAEAAPGLGASADRAERQLESRRGSPPKTSERVGTGHGRRLESSAYEVAFQRATDRPQAVIAIGYDSYANLVAQGVIPRPQHHAPHRPDPFPAGPGFVPDP